MKTKVKLMVGIGISVFLLSSCEKKLDPVLEVPIEEETGKPSLSAVQDSLETLYMMQSNPELMLADRIISESTGFVLDISEQEAYELEIPDELYQKYLEKVAELNKNIK